MNAPLPSRGDPVTDWDLLDLGPGESSALTRLWRVSVSTDGGAISTGATSMAQVARSNGAQPEATTAATSASAMPRPPTTSACRPAEPPCPRCSPTATTR